MKKILIIFGGNSTEHYVSCKSAYSILENIDKKMFDVKSVGINLNNDWFIYEDNIEYLKNGDWIDKNVTKINNIIEFLKTFDVVFPIIHGTNGEDGKLQGLLDLFNIKYIGCNTISSAIGMDKAFTKYVVEKINIPQVKYTVIKDSYNIKSIEKLSEDESEELILTLKGWNKLVFDHKTSKWRFFNWNRKSKKQKGIN